jgi:hypothetical protein
MTHPRPFLSIWFGNFFEPFVSDRDSVRRGIAEVASLGFTSINLDSKAWEDFFARARGEKYRGQDASPYVAMQEYMMHQAARHGLDYTHLALYLCGDNLYPTIRDVPPIRGEQSIRPNGEPMGTYKYWSPCAQSTMVEHVRNLLKLYGNGMHRRANSGKVVMQTMFEPIPKPSFDKEGKRRYLKWIEKRFDGNIATLNARYNLNATSFDDLQPSEYWLRPEELNWVDCARPTARDFALRTPDFHRWIDNQTYLARELIEYLAAMKSHWRTMQPPIFIEPVLHQWGYFFNPPNHHEWQTGQRALDVYKCAQHVDSVLFIASPLNAENRPDAMALSVEASIMRCANSCRPFTAGLYLGRHVNCDIYRTISPAESIATLVASGADGLHIYGYSGLDDGGVMYRMDQPFKDSLKAANRWASEVIPLLNAPREKQVALLFPAEMSLYEPLELDNEGRHRMDLLGWYSQFIDLGWQVDILHPMQIAQGALSDYKILVIPHNSLYDLGDNIALEFTVKQFVASGGTFFHGPNCQLAQSAFAIRESPIDFDCIHWHEDVIPHGWSTVSFETGTALATYIQSSKTAIAETKFGAGRVYSFGFEYGYSYSRSTMPVVPPNYGRREIHPIVLLKQTPIAAYAGTAPNTPLPAQKGLEFARFGSRWIIVNHTANPVNLIPVATGKMRHALPITSDWLLPHSALLLEP